MPRRTTDRLTSILLLLAFLGVMTAEAFAVRECPHHDLPAASVAGDTAASHHGETRSASARTAADGDVGGEPVDTGAPCSCIGTCHAAADAPLDPSEPATENFVERTAFRAPPPPATSSLSPDPAYLLPFPNGPPFSA